MQLDFEFVLFVPSSVCMLSVLICVARVDQMVCVSTTLKPLPLHLCICSLAPDKILLQLVDLNRKLLLSFIFSNILLAIKKRYYAEDLICA